MKLETLESNSYEIVDDDTGYTIANIEIFDGQVMFKKVGNEAYGLNGNFWDMEDMIKVLGEIQRILKRVKGG